ncbi:MAG: hypothetical protein AAF916_04770 [Planctomycetota bacterium]
MHDLQNPRWMYLKAALFVGIAVISATLLVLESPKLRTAVLLALLMWASCRAYYFAFYVIEKYIDPSYRFAGLIDFVRYLYRGR